MTFSEKYQQKKFKKLIENFCEHYVTLKEIILSLQESIDRDLLQDKRLNLIYETIEDAQKILKEISTNATTDRVIKVERVNELLNKIYLLIFRLNKNLEKIEWFSRQQPKNTWQADMQEWYRKLKECVEFILHYTKTLQRNPAFLNKEKLEVPKIFFIPIAIN